MTDTELYGIYDSVELWELPLAGSGVLGYQLDNFQQIGKGNNNALEEVLPEIPSDLNRTTIYFSVKYTFYHQYDNQLVYFIIHIFFKGHPRSAIILDTTIAITNKQRTLNIAVPIISYPQPTLIGWTFIQNGTTYITDVESTYITTTYGIYQHVSQLIKDDLTDSYYGTYSINVSNNIEPYFQHDFKVVPESKDVLHIQKYCFVDYV